MHFFEFNLCYLKLLPIRGGRHSLQMQSVSTQRFFNVVTTLMTSKQRCIKVKTTFIANAQYNSILYNLFVCEKMFFFYLCNLGPRRHEVFPMLGVVCCLQFDWKRKRNWLALFRGLCNYLTVKIYFDPIIRYQMNHKKKKGSRVP